MVGQFGGADEFKDNSLPEYGLKKGEQDFFICISKPVLYGGGKGENGV